MQGGQRPPGPGRSIYLARRIVAGLVVLLVLALIGNWAWQSFLKPAPESASEAPESTSVSSSTEQTVTEEGSGPSPEESVVSNEAPQQNTQASTQGFTENPEAVSFAPVPEEPVVLPPVGLPVNTSPSESVPPPPISNPPPLPAPTPPQPSPPATGVNEAMNPTAAQGSPNLATIPQSEIVQPPPLEKPVPFPEQAGFQGGPPFEEPALTEQAPFESSALEQGTSANVSATAGNIAATSSSRGAIASAGSVTAMAG